MELWKQGPVTRGEGIYACYNRGSCIKPDNCTCPDGWAGHDCNQRAWRRAAVPFAAYDHALRPAAALCRHLNAFEDVVTCQNDAVCVGKDACTCITARPALYELYPALEQRREADFETGWAGSDCSIGARCCDERRWGAVLTRQAVPALAAKCTQGFFDQSCKGVASGGEGCYRCLNGGNCTAPDLCTCTADYRGYDCGERALRGRGCWRGAAARSRVIVPAPLRSDLLQACVDDRDLPPGHGGQGQGGGVRGGPVLYLGAWADALLCAHTHTHTIRRASRVPPTCTHAHALSLSFSHTHSRLVHRRRKWCPPPRGSSPAATARRRTRASACASRRGSRGRTRWVGRCRRATPTARAAARTGLRERGRRTGAS